MVGLLRQFGVFACLGLPLAVSQTSLLAGKIVVALSGGDFTSIQSALNAARPGDTVIVGAGVYREKISFPTSGNATAGPIILQAAAGATPVLSGINLPGSNMVLIEDRSYIKVIGFEIRDNSGVNDGSGIRIIGSGSHIELRNNKIHEIRGTDAMGITVYGTSALSSLSNIIIDGNEIYDCEPAQSEALTLNGNVEAFQVTNNTVRDVNSIGIDFIGGESGFPAPPLVARNGVCRGNRVIRSRSNYGGGFGAGIYVDGGRDIIVENNVVTESDLGLEVGAENPGVIASGVIVRNNIIYGNDKAGLLFGGFDASRGRARSCQFLNNVSYKNDTLNQGLGQLWIQFAEDNILRNNIFWAAGNQVLLFSEAGNLNNALDYNLWFQDGGSHDDSFTWNSVSYGSFPAYQNGTQQDSHSLRADPQFVDGPAADFHILPGSPAVEAGDPGYVPPPDVVDLDGEPRLMGSRVDLGVDELLPGQSTSSTTTTTTSSSSTTLGSTTTTTSTNPGTTSTTTTNPGNTSTTTSTTIPGLFRHYFPQIQFSSNLLPSGTLAGVAVANLFTSTAALNFKAYTNSGHFLGDAARLLDARNQFADLVVNLFPSTAGTARWLILESDVPAVEGFFLLFDEELTIMDGTTVSGAVSKEFLFTVVDDAEISMANPSSATVTFKLDYMDESGTMRGTIQGSIPPWGRTAIPASGIRPPGLSGGYLRGTSDGVVPLEFFGKPGWIATLPGVDVPSTNPKSPVAKLLDSPIVSYAPQYAAGGGFASFLDLVNLESRAISLTLQLYADDGTQLGTTGSLQLPALGSVRFADPSILGLTAGPNLIQGYVRIESDGGRFAGSVLFTDAAGTRFGTALPFVQGGFTTTYFSQVAQNDLYFTGLAAVNANATPIMAEIMVYDTSGAVLAVGNRQIPAGGRFSMLLSQLVGALPPLTKGFFRMNTSMPAVSFALFGTNNGEILSAIPSQSLSP